MHFVELGIFYLVLTFQNFLHVYRSSVFPHLPLINDIGLDPNVLAPGGMYDYKHAVY